MPGPKITNKSFTLIPQLQPAYFEVFAYSLRVKKATFLVLEEMALSTSTILLLINSIDDGIKCDGICTVHWHKNELTAQYTRCKKCSVTNKL